MKLNATIKIAFRALWRQKIRTFLTSFAVFIGIFLIIVMVSGTVGGEELLRRQFTDAFDLRNVFVGAKGTLQFNFASPTVEEDEVKPVTPSVVEEIKKITNITKVQEIVLISGKTLTIEGQEKPIKNIFGSGFDLVPEDRYIQEIVAGEVRYLQSDEALLTNKISDA